MCVSLVKEIIPITDTPGVIIGGNDGFDYILTISGGTISYKQI